MEITSIENQSRIAKLRTFSRLVWILLAGGAFLLTITAAPYRYDMLARDVYSYGTAVTDQGLTYRWFALYFTAVEVIIGMSFVVVATIIAWRKAGDWLALLVAATLAYLVVLLPLVDGLIFANPNWLPLIIILRVGVYSGLIAMLCLFPDGRFIPSWAHWFLLAWFLFVILSWRFVSVALSDMAIIPNARTLEDGLTLLVMSGWLGAGMLLQLLRYRSHATPEQRQQTKWVLYGLLLTFIVSLVNAVLLTVLPTLREDAGSNFLYVLVGGSIILFALFCFALMVAFAIFRYRLWDIDILINRTLVYGSLTSITVGIYVLIVGGIGSLLQSQSSAVIAFIATGLVAVLFQPLRVRLQTAVDRLMYGQRDDPVGMLAHLAHQLEVVDRPERILPTLVETIATALKIPYVALWQSDSEKQWLPSAVFGQKADDLHMIPLLHQNHEVGRLFVASRRLRERFSKEDERLLSAIAQLSATTVQAAQLSAELQQSRRQLVTSREEERRRLRRDLHDGLGPVLASVALQADTARDLAHTDPDETELLLNNIMEQAQTAVGDVRRLVYDLRPPTLDEMGLVGALRQAAKSYQHQVRISITAPEPLPALPAAVEVAAYRIIREALNNVLKHAHAASCRVVIHVGEYLDLVVEDDGQGLPESAVSGVGLISMKERASELGGSCTIALIPGGGTRVEAELPLTTGEKM